MTQLNPPSLRSRRGFTLIELLTVIAMIAILSAILIPTVGQMRKQARKTADMNKLRQIANASLMFASENSERLVAEDHTIDVNGVAIAAGGTEIVDVAATLAVGAGLNELSIWVSDSDSTDKVGDGAVVTGAAGTYAKNAAITDLSFEYVVNLTMAAPPTTPLAFSRMTDTSTSNWANSDIYGGDGGHIVFIGGNVSWFNTLTGQLVDGEGNTENNINAAIDAAAMPVGLTPKISTNGGVVDPGA